MDIMPCVLVTGAADGIGKSVCEVFLREGYRVIGLDLQKSEGHPYEVIPFDIRTLSQPGTSHKDFYQKTEELSRGKLDALVNNAAIQILKPVEELSPEDWHMTLDTNVLAPFFLIQLFLPMLRKAGGSVVNIASIHAQLTKAEFAAYSTSKGALVSLTRALAIELAPDVRVNAVLPAPTDTPMLRAGFKERHEGLHELGEYHPLKRIAQPEEIAEVTLFLAGKKSSFMTGASIMVDGGISGCLHDPVGP